MSLESHDQGWVWPGPDQVVLSWLLNGTCDQRYLDDIFVAFCQKMEQQGLPLARAAAILHVEHPQWLDVRVSWRSGMVAADVSRTDDLAGRHDGDEEGFAAFLPEGAAGVRVRLTDAAFASKLHPFLERLRQEGVTDYFACPLRFTLGKSHFVSFASTRPGGFAEDHVRRLAGLVPALSSVMEIRVKNRLARDLLDTYVGAHAGEAILAGAIHRGSGFTVEAAILVADLRGFTSISDMQPRDEIIALLNEYFDTLAEPIEQHSGEILKFTGDGLLAIFPHDAPAAFRAVEDICIGMSRINARRITSGRPPLEFGIGCNYGDVMYGNIGSRKRLDFTVIGPAVNIAARLETLSKELERKALFSAAFATRANCRDRLQRCGSFPLRGVGEPIAVFSLAEVRTRTTARRSRPTWCSTTAGRREDVSSRRRCDRLAPGEHLLSRSGSLRTRRPALS
jgi:adenylate cyclase